jgi:hypothetical protein
LFNTAYEVALDVSRFGVGLFKIRHDERAIVEAQHALGLVSGGLSRTMSRMSRLMCWLDLRAEEQSGAGGQRLLQRYLKLEIHEKGRITTRLHKLAAGNIAGLVEESIVQTGVDDFLVVPVFNLSTSDRLTGLDDYSDLDSIVQELEIRMAQISRILDKHADPNMCGPDSALEQDLTTGQWTYRGGGKYFPVGQGEQPPAYVTWDGQLEAALKQLDVLMEQFYTLERDQSAAAFGQLKAGLAESGSALRRLMMAPLAKVNRIQLRFDPALKDVLMAGFELLEWPRA